ncbi:MAG: hypothetical protein LUD15_03270 [Bacteroides sp.]|nr:hypothetical protein [Bacteroides sp.]
MVLYLQNHFTENQITGGVENRNRQVYQEKYLQVYEACMKNAAYLLAHPFSEQKEEFLKEIEKLCNGGN